jgi:hypothetical protein
MSMKPFPARIHVLLAQEAHVGLVIRRGPARSVCTMLWDMDRDEFTLGQWFKGRIYERRADLSPDGKYLIYFAMNGRWNEEGAGAWTAVSRAPYLKALAFYPQGSCWNGGGLFTGPRKYWLNACGPATRETREVGEDNEFVLPVRYNNECLGVYYPRLLRDGWKLVERIPGRDLFEKPAGHGWTLRKFAHAECMSAPGRGCYWDTHELWHPATMRRIDGNHWEWAEVDRDRLVWAAGGKLFAGRLGNAGLTDEATLCDFNGMTFEAIEAPY